MATWTVSGIGSNSTGSFTFPANTGTTDKSYTITYDDGNGNTATTSFTVPACDITYLYAIDNNNSKSFACSGGTDSNVISSLKESSDGTRYAVGCTVTSAPSWISSYSLSETAAIGAYSLTYTVPANTAGSRSGTFTITQNESGRQVYATVNQPDCSKSTNSITLSVSLTQGGNAEAVLAADYIIPTGTTISCQFTLKYKTTSGDTKESTQGITITGGASRGSVGYFWSDAESIVSYCLSSTGISSDDTYNYTYNPTC